MSIKASAWIFAKGQTRNGAYFHVAFMVVVATTLVTSQFTMALFGVDAYLFRLLWIAIASGWALRLTYLADKEQTDGRDATLGRRRGVLVASLMAVGVFATSIF